MEFLKGGPMGRPFLTVKSQKKDLLTKTGNVIT